MARNIFVREKGNRWRPVCPADANQDGLGDLLQLLSEDGATVLEFEDDDDDLPEGGGAPEERWEDHILTHPMTSDGGWMND